MVTDNPSPQLVEPKRVCGAIKKDGRPCGLAPLEGREHCFMHDPTVARERLEARRLGGLRRRREKSLASVYDWDGLETVDGIRRVLVISVADLLGLENSVARCRTLGTLMQVALKALEVGELEDRVAAIEENMKQQAEQTSSFGNR